MRRYHSPISAPRLRRPLPYPERSGRRRRRWRRPGGRRRFRSRRHSGRRCSARTERRWCRRPTGRPPGPSAPARRGIAIRRLKPSPAFAGRFARGPRHAPSAPASSERTWPADWRTRRPAPDRTRPGRHPRTTPNCRRPCNAKSAAGRRRRRQPKANTF